MSSSDSAADKISEGLTDFAIATNDPGSARPAGVIYRKVAGALDPLVRPDDVCKLAFTSMIIRPGLRVECLAVVLGDRLVVAWKAGMLRGATAETIPFSSITGIRRERGTGALRGAQLLVIAGAPAVTLALSQAQADTEFAVIRTAIGTEVG
jgi:hypothetical protein